MGQFDKFDLFHAFLEQINERVDRVMTKMIMVDFEELNHLIPLDCIHNQFHPFITYIVGVEIDLPHIRLLKLINALSQTLYLLYTHCIVFKS